MVAVHGGEAGHVHYHPMPPAMLLPLPLSLSSPWHPDGWMVLHVPIFSTEHKSSQHTSSHQIMVSPAFHHRQSIGFSRRPSARARRKATLRSEAADNYLSAFELYKMRCQAASTAQSGQRSACYLLPECL
ncbi:hypothetical protein EJB05_34977, partial [Eragrostis curvula]